MLHSQDPLYLQATTACLTTIVIMQMANLFACRDPAESAFQSRRMRNPLIWIGLLFELTLILFIVYTPAGNALFSTAPVPLSVWLLAAALAAGMLFAEELRKRVLRRKRRESAKITPP